MTFPAIQDADTKSGVQTSNASTWTLTYPTNIVSNDLLIGFAALDGASLFSWTNSGWDGNLVNTGSGANVLSGGYKRATGTETGTFTLTTDAGSEQGAWRIYRISHALESATATATTGADTTPDPPPLNPPGWDVEDTLWIAACSVDTSRTISVYPLGDLQTADVSGGANGATLGLCSTNSAVASLDPSTFTISNSDDWVAFTLAIRPTAATVMLPGTANPLPFVPRGRSL